MEPPFCQILAEKTGGLKNCLDNFAGIIGHAVGVNVQTGNIMGNQVF
jgi:hypothetical protein